MHIESVSATGTPPHWLNSPIYWKEVKSHTKYVQSGFKQLKTRQKAEVYVPKVLTLGHLALFLRCGPLCQSFFACLLMDSVVRSICLPPINPAISLWGPAVTAPTHSEWVGASCLTKNTGELSATFHALKWLCDEGAGPLDPPSRSSHRSGDLVGD